MAFSTAVDQSAVARVLGIETIFKDLRAGGILFLPQRLGLVGQGNSAATYDTTKAQYTSSNAIGTAYGFGSPLHLASRQLLPINGDGIGTIPLTVYPLEDDGSGVAATGDITPSGTQTVQASYKVRVNNIDSNEFVISVGDSVADITAAMTAAINAVLEMPIIAADGTTVVNLTSKWAGVSANDIFVEIVGSTTAGTSFAITQLSGGLVNPDIATALDQVGNVWETMMLNCIGADTTVLDDFSTFNEGRWGALVRKPLVAIYGNTDVTVSAATAITDARPTDRTNVQLVAPGSNDLPFVVAARELARVIALANENPPHDYGSQDATGLTPGADGDQWDYLERDQAVKAGSSTVEVKDGVVNVSDVVTCYHPTGDPVPAYRYVVDIVKLQNIIFNTDLIFASKRWDGAPLIPDDQPTINRDAKKPRTAISDVADMLTSLGLNAIISDVPAAIASIQAGINEQNPKRLDVSFTVKLSGNSNIKSIDLNFGFFYGTATAVA